ncbi:DUF5627 domain-containing protein [Paraflavisolibacter sp. H34]|uniref:DUF5627 domain-containing protein n=1 Tax=Huijunlia imazamoxiresistens TaxID=3127457 RepID=UPI00301909C4
MKTFKILAGLAIAAGTLAACTKNQENTFSDFDYQTLYFGSQFPVRTVELGEDLFVDNSLDNERKVLVKATMGGVRENKKDVVVGVSVDESLCNNLYFSANGSKVIPLPSHYYKLASNEITIPKGSILGGVEVQLTDAFFDDPLSLVNTYALPLVMGNAKGGDSILRGVSSVANPNRSIDAHWVIKPRDFVLYALKYVNPWHGNYLRRGTDVITGSVQQTLVRHKPYVENDEVNKLSSASLSKLHFPVVFKNAGGTNVPCTLQLTFDASGNCTVASATTGVTASGSGRFVKKGDKNSWGNKDRDALYLNYTVDLSSQNMHVSTNDTLVMRDRAVTMETFTPVFK